MDNLSPETAQFDPGMEIAAWQSYNYHPHRRGIVWYIVFCAVLFGGAVWSLLSDPKWGWLMAVSFFLAAAVYFLVHRKGEEIHEVKIFEQGILIDQKFIVWEKFAGFWLLYDETIALVNLKLKHKYRTENISLQMGEKSPEFFRGIFAKLKIEELKDEKESLLDLWIRALKL